MAGRCRVCKSILYRSFRWGAHFRLLEPCRTRGASTRLQLHLLGVHRHAVYDRTIDTSELSEAEIAANSGANTTGALALVPSLAIAHGLNRGAFDFGVGAAAFIDRAGRTSWKKHLDAPVEIPGAGRPAEMGDH